MTGYGRGYGRAMVRHVVMFSFKDDAAPRAIDAYEAAIRGLPAIIPQIRDFKVGRDIGVNPGNLHMVVNADFDSVADYLAYRDNPDHQRVIKELGAPIMAQRAAVQFEW